MSFSSHSRNHLSMRSTGLDSSRAIIVPRRRSQITMRKKVACDADLIRSRDCPCRCCSITGVVRGDSNPQALGGVPRHHRPDRGIRQCSSFCTYPEGIACRPTKHTRSNVIVVVSSGGMAINHFSPSLTRSRPIWIAAKFLCRGGMNPRNAIIKPSR